MSDMARHGCHGGYEVVSEAMDEGGIVALKIINYLRREVIAESGVYVDGKEVGMIVVKQEWCNDQYFLIDEGEIVVIKRSDASRSQCPTFSGGNAESEDIIMVV